jgi:hypothetical protein
MPGVQLSKNMSTMTESDSYRYLIEHLRPFEARLRRRAGLSWATWAAGAGLAAALLLALAGRLFPLLPTPHLLALCLGVVLALILGALGVARLRPASLLAIARRCDHELALAERLSTAVELGSGRLKTSPHLAEAQLRDAEGHLAVLAPGSAFPWRLSRRRAGVLLALAAALVAAFALPNPQDAILQRRAQEQEVIAQETAKLEELRAELVAEGVLTNTPQGELALKTLDDLIAELKAGQLSPEEALAAISAAEGELSKLQAAADARRAGLGDAADALSEHDATADAARELEGGDYDAAAAALSGELPTTPEEMQDLADALRAAAARTAATDPQLAASLEAASQALEAGDLDAAQQALAQAAEALAEAGQELAAQEAVEGTLARIQDARQAIAQAGEGEGQEGAAIAEGEGTGEGTEQAIGVGVGAGGGTGQDTVGGGSGIEEPGAGADGLTAEGGTEGQMPTTAPPRGREGDYEPVYAPQHLGGDEGPVTAPPPQEQPGEVPLGEVPGQPPQQPGGASVPYDQVYADYHDAAADALQSSYIPLGMKEYVRQYFSALEPSR